MVSNKRSLMEKKLEENRRKLKDKVIEEQRKQIADRTKDFEEKYRFASAAETERLNEAISELDISSPAHVRGVECGISQHHNMYLCFLCGTEELLDIYIFGKYEDILRDMDDWKSLSPYLLLADEDLMRFVYINDDGEIKEYKTL